VGLCGEPDTKYRVGSKADLDDWQDRVAQLASPVPDRVRIEGQWVERPEGTSKANWKFYLQNQAPSLDPEVRHNLEADGKASRPSCGSWLHEPGCEHFDAKINAFLRGEVKTRLDAILLRHTDNDGQVDWEAAESDPDWTQYAAEQWEMERRLPEASQRPVEVSVRPSGGLARGVRTTILLTG
jgi:hypothetical protein